MDFCIDFLGNLLYGSGVAHSMIILALIVGIGVYLSRIKIAGISFGVTWVLFIGILFSHYGMTLDSELLHFVKEFGLILFVYSIKIKYNTLIGVISGSCTNPPALAFSNQQ